MYMCARALVYAYLCVCVRGSGVKGRVHQITIDRSSPFATGITVKLTIWYEAVSRGSLPIHTRVNP